ncbi:ABC transporter ATP-binding protein [Sodalis praecaptivus]|uniref:ABC transporter ATP-binding protein n=1 Tax=Sodalis praecaptivus TaxID=1239307 RepID=UPI00280AE40B|nr:ABC transporter ATP-binding protein [Sodalis praecaptivus]
MMRAFTSLTLEGVSYAFGAQTVLDQIDLHIEPGEIVALLGPSGCGKSTLLRLLAGLTQPARGTIRFGERVVARPGWALPPEQRDLGMVFQDYALWPHMTVAQNVDFPLRMRHVAREERARRVVEALDRVGLTAFAARRPAGLSGGQQQRVALARAIVAEPGVLLFDEPLSNLDSALRDSLSREMARLLRQLGTTAVYVTHDRHEAERLAHRIVHLSTGRVQAVRQVSLSSGGSHTKVHVG